MNRLENAREWYESQLSRLKHIQQLSEEHDQDPKLRDLFGPLLKLKKPDRKIRLQAERNDLYRMALMRLFAGFEAEFKAHFFEYIAQRSGMTRKQVEETLPDAISTWLVMYRVLEPRKLSESLLGRINRIRDERNRLAHSGFHQDFAHTSPDDVYHALRAPLETFS